ncbi:hypothetical protein HHI36_001876 [Cryptolaemus montrouzieri]|uniref:Uncharacterized protein n=1 Tax=Cryptolaemus montrouzieri TaxID=559131 RepID=A0ABD2P8V5_9CUCU
MKAIPCNCENIKLLCEPNLRIRAFMLHFEAFFNEIYDNQRLFKNMAESEDVRYRELRSVELNKLKKKCIIDILATKNVPKKVTNDILKMFFKELFVCDANNVITENVFEDDVGNLNDNDNCATHNLANPTANVNKNNLNINNIQNIDRSSIVVPQMPPSKSAMGDIEDPKITTNNVDNRDENYANALKKPSNNKRKNKVTVAEGENLKSVPKVSYVHAYRFDPSTKAQDITIYLKPHMNVLNCDE